MSPIINPAYIYLISRLDSIIGVCEFICFVLAFCSIGSLMIYLYINDSTDEFCYTTYNRTKIDIMNNAKRVKNMCERSIKMLEEKDNIEYKDLKDESDYYSAVFQDIFNQQEKLLKIVKSEENRKQYYTKLGTRCFISLCIMIFLKSLIPDTNTGYQLFILSYITPDNLNLTAGITKEGIEFIINSVITAIQQLR